MTERKRRPIHQEREQHKILRDEAYRTVFAPLLDQGEDIDLARARELLDEFNARLKLENQRPIRAGELVYSTLDFRNEMIHLKNPYHSGVLASITLQELEEELPKEESPQVREVMFVEREIAHNILDSVFPRIRIGDVKIIEIPLPPTKPN